MDAASLLAALAAYRIDLPVSYQLPGVPVTGMYTGSSFLYNCFVRVGLTATGIYYYAGSSVASFQLNFLIQLIDLRLKIW